MNDTNSGLLMIEKNENNWTVQTLYDITSIPLKLKEFQLII